MLFTTAPGTALAGKSVELQLRTHAECQRVSFSLTSPRTPPLQKTLDAYAHPHCHSSVRWIGTGCGCRWKASRTPLRKAAVMRVMEKDGEKGSREPK